MSVGVSVASTKEPRTFSIGPLKVQIFTYAAVSGDTTMTATATSMTSVFHGFLTGGFVETSATTYSTNVATFTFTDPAANRFGFVMLFGV